MPYYGLSISNSDVFNMKNMYQNWWNTLNDNEGHKIPY